MRPIDKTQILATAYKKWLDELDKAGEDHPTYHSGHRHYNDVRANLLWVQGGLCAYTETYLIDAKKVNPKLWKDGTFNNYIEPFGQIDHYNSNLKTNKGWDWDNLFFVHSDINNRKRNKDVYLLKPDIAGYQPSYYLEYDIIEHIFLVNPLRSEDEFELITKDIFTLGLNYGAVVNLRREKLSPLFADIEFNSGSSTYQNTLLSEFPTAFEMGAAKIEAQRP